MAGWVVIEKNMGVWADVVMMMIDQVRFSLLFYIYIYISRHASFFFFFLFPFFFFFPTGGGWEAHGRLTLQGPPRQGLASSPSYLSLHPDIPPNTYLSTWVLPPFLPASGPPLPWLLPPIEIRSSPREKPPPPSRALLLGRPRIVPRN